VFVAVSSAMIVPPRTADTYRRRPSGDTTAHPSEASIRAGGDTLGLAADRELGDRLSAFDLEHVAWSRMIKPSSEHSSV
jgi:hypothetical protein